MQKNTKKEGQIPDIYIDEIRIPAVSLPVLGHLQSVPTGTISKNLGVSGKK